MAETKSIVILSDCQLPYEDKRAVAAVIRFIAEYNPDEIVHIGDVMDYPQPSRWTKGTAGEFEGSVFRDSQYAKDNFLDPLRNAYDGPIGFLEGNHDLRARVYLARYAPALAESGAFNFESLLDFKSYNIKKLPEFYKFAPNWIMTHGHLGGLSISRIGANTALNAAKKLGVSVIMGHTHRLGISSESKGFDGQVIQTLTGMEVGNLMNMRKAHYLKGAAGNWQQGFGLVHITGKHVHAQPIAINAGKFTVEGMVYAL